MIALSNQAVCGSGTLKKLVSLIVLLLLVSPAWAETVIFTDGRGCKGCTVHWVDKKHRIADYITEKDGSVYTLQDGEQFTVYRHPYFGAAMRALSQASFNYAASQRQYTPAPIQVPSTSSVPLAGRAGLPTPTPSTTPGTSNLYANDGTYLGNTGSKFDVNSVNNPYGKYGSPYSPDSITNPYGQYGSKYSITSPNNPYSQPGTVVPSGGGTPYKFGGYSH